MDTRRGQDVGAISTQLAVTQILRFKGRIWHEVDVVSILTPCTHRRNARRQIGVLIAHPSYEPGASKSRTHKPFETHPQTMARFRRVLFGNHFRIVDGCGRWLWYRAHGIAAAFVFHAMGITLKPSWWYANA